jgi:hypothetical protein
MIYFAQKITDLISQTDLPLDFISISESEGLDGFLDFIYYTDPAFSVSANGAYFGITIIFTIRLSINFGGDSGFEIAISGDSEESSLFQLNLNVFIGSNGRLSILFSDLGFQFLISREILKPFPERDGRSMIFVDGNLKLDESFNLIIEGYDSINLSESEIGNTGIIISAENIKFDFSRDSAIPEVLEIGLDESFIGVYIGQAVVRYQKEGDQINYRFVVSRSAIGDRGFTGEIGLGSLEFATESADIPVADVLNSLFNDDGEALEVDESGSEPLTLYPVNLLGMKMVLQYFGITFRQSIPTTSQILGFVFMPFADRWVRLRASIGGPNGDFMLEVGGTGDAGLIDLDTDVFQIIVDSIAYQNREGINYAIISGSIRLKVPEGLNMPAFRADKISISERGDIEIEGGWVRAPEQINIDLGGFKIGIREIGLGNEGEETPATRRQWVGFSGEVQLVEGLPIRGSVEGLKISWLQNPPAGMDKDIRVSLRGIAVNFTIPGTLQFSGSVNYDERTNLFKGNIRLNLIALRLEIEAQLMVGKFKDAEGREFGVFYIALSAQLPTGIPLAATGTALYGVRGLVGVNVAPGKTETDNWYDWYKSGVTAEDRYSVTPVSKWVPMFDNFGFGAGISLGTIYDDGTTINLNAMLVVLIPGPVILLEGKANLLKQRSDNKAEEGAFYLLAALDGRAGTFQLNIDIRYSLEDIVTVGGGLEAFFDFNSSENWHIWIGQKTPETKRIRAEILSLFSANLYFMIDSRSLMFGASVGLNINETYGPVELRIIARVSLDAAIFFKPFQLEGSLQFLLDIALTIFGIGLRLYLEALLSGQTPEPFKVYGKAKLIIGLFWPIPTIECEVEFSWEKPAKTFPTWPLFKAIGEASFISPNPSLPRVAVLQHHKSSDLRVDFLCLPEGTVPDPARIPVAPIDSRPALTFAKKLHYLGTQQITAEPDRPGNGEFWYHLDDLCLEISEDGISYSLVRHGINAVGTPDLPFFMINVNQDPNNGDDYFINRVDAQEPVVELWKYHAWDRLHRYQRQTETSENPPCGRKPQPGYVGTCEWLTETPRQLPPEFAHQGLFFMTRPAPVNPQNPDEIRPPFIGQALWMQKNITMLRSQSLTVFFPEKCVQAIIYLFFDSAEIRAGGMEDDARALQIQAFLDGVPVGINSAPQYQNGLFIVAVNAPGRFNSLSINEQGSSDNAFWLYTLYYLTAPEFVPVNTAARNTEGGDPTRENGFVRQEPVLLANKYYRLTVRTSVSGSSSATENTCLYFRTDDGPGIIRDPHGTTSKPYLPYATFTVADSDTDVTDDIDTSRIEAPNSTPEQPSFLDPRDYVGNPVNRFDSYLLGTYPVHGAMAHYRDEPIVIGFNERYLLKMFEGRPLRLRIRDRNGQYLAMPAAGLSVLLGIPLLYPGLMAWLSGLDSGACTPAAGSPAQMGTGLSFAASPDLRPNTLYFVEVTTTRSVGAETVVVFDFQFTASRYRSFNEHIRAIGTPTPVHWVGNAALAASQLKQPALAANRMRYIHALEQYQNLLTRLASEPTLSHQQVVESFENLKKLKADWENESALLFDNLYAQVEPAFVVSVLLPDGTRQEVDMRQRGLPEKPEMIAIPIADGQQLLLWESPEPLDWAGIIGTVQRSSDRPEIFNFATNRDKTCAFMMYESELAFQNGTYNFTLNWQPFNGFESSLALDEGSRLGEGRRAAFSVALNTTES